jgi:hypothetical protein
MMLCDKLRRLYYLMINIVHYCIQSRYFLASSFCIRVEATHSPWDPGIDIICCYYIIIKFYGDFSLIQWRTLVISYIVKNSNIMRK